MISKQYIFAVNFSKCLPLFYRNLNDLSGKNIFGFVQRFSTHHDVHSKSSKTNQNNGKKFSDTLNLPKSQYPMKHSRNIEKLVEEKFSFTELYGLNQNNECKKTRFILHDGPPYANGDVHFGHAINKILKDIFLKRKQLENNEIFYVPGWDCHGLPIELKALTQEQQSSLSTLDPLAIRSKARALATDAIERQRAAFRQWFLSADLSKPYVTFDIDYTVNQLNAFYSMYRDGLIFRDCMPVYWSPSTRTALAEAELQYNHEHISLSAYVKYKIINCDQLLDKYKSKISTISALIWTTTPWTLLANEAIAYSNSLSYCLASIENLLPSDELVLLARDTVSTLEAKFQQPIRIVEEISIHDISKWRYKDPNSDATRPFLSSPHVTISKGTGLVHTAPNHGHEDYKLAQNHGLNYNRNCIVDSEGNLKIAHLPKLEPLSITQDNQASKFVLNELYSKSTLFTEEYQHSYPYDWRSGKPVLITPSYQWFLNIDLIRSQLLQALDTVRIYPERLRKEFVYHIEHRPNWCLSRQRKWGVPIPVFYQTIDSQQEPLLNENIFQTVLAKLKLHGCDIWWQESVEQLLQQMPSSNSIDIKSLTKGEDILDIWFDSGCSWLSVLPQPEQVADMYIEGVDQIRGWFQSSLITSVALRNCAPYKTIFIHGFALDKNGKKMSKSIGNVIDPMDIIEGKFHFPDRQELKKKTPKKNLVTNCGVDGLRFWIARYACTHSDVHVDVNEFSDDVLAILNRFRNSFRFILGYLNNDRFHTDLLLPVDQYWRMPLLDKHMLYCLLSFHQNCNRYYADKNLGDLVEQCIHHVSFELSTFYMTRIKDRLYCEPLNQLETRAILTTLYHCYHTVAYHLAPVLPHVVLEANEHCQLSRDAIFEPTTNLDHFVTHYLFPPQSTNHELVTGGDSFVQRMRIAFNLIETLNKWTQNKHRLIEYDCHLVIPDTLLDDFQFFQITCEPNSHSDLCELLQVASTSYSAENNCLATEYSTINEKTVHKLSMPLYQNDDDSGSSSQSNSIELILSPSRKYSCVRCRRFVSEHQDQLCNRCIQYV